MPPRPLGRVLCGTCRGPADSDTIAALGFEGVVSRRLVSCHGRRGSSARHSGPSKRLYYRDQDLGSSTPVPTPNANLLISVSRDGLSHVLCRETPVRAKHLKNFRSRTVWLSYYV